MRGRCGGCEGLEVGGLCEVLETLARDGLEDWKEPVYLGRERATAQDGLSRHHHMYHLDTGPRIVEQVIRARVSNYMHKLGTFQSQRLSCRKRPSENCHSASCASNGDDVLVHLDVNKPSDTVRFPFEFQQTPNIIVIVTRKNQTMFQQLFPRNRNVGRLHPHHCPYLLDM